MKSLLVSLNNMWKWYPFRIHRNGTGYDIRMNSAVDEEMEPEHAQLIGELRELLQEELPLIKKGIAKTTGAANVAKRRQDAINYLAQADVVAFNGGNPDLHAFAWHRVAPEWQMMLKERLYNSQAILVGRSAG